MGRDKDFGDLAGCREKLVASADRDRYLASYTVSRAL